MKNLFSILFLAFISLAIGGVDLAPLVGVGLIGLSFVMPRGVLLATIPAADVRNVFTKTMVSLYKEKISVMSFLRSFFPAKEAMSKEISIQVQRGTELVAVDVERGTNGNRNKMTRSTEKIFLPPYYREYMTVNEHRLYDVAIGTQDTGVMAQLTSELAEELMELQKKIERRYELQCAQVLETGIVTLVNGTNIDFGRKAGSLVDVSGSNPWATGTNNPITDLINGCKFLRETGKAAGGRFIGIFGETALEQLLSNDTFVARADVRRLNLDDVRQPEMSNGATYHGTITAGSYVIDLWAYPEIYETVDSAGTITTNNYINPKKVILLPSKPNFVLSFAAVPRLLGQAPQQGAYLVQDYIDERLTAHETAIMSAGVAIPVAVDQIYTLQPVA